MPERPLLIQGRVTVGAKHRRTWILGVELAALGE